MTGHTKVSPVKGVATCHSDFGSLDIALAAIRLVDTPIHTLLIDALDALKAVLTLLVEVGALEVLIAFLSDIEAIRILRVAPSDIGGLVVRYLVFVFLQPKHDAPNFTNTKVAR